jgi:two-component system, OmpR family, alkaline phosphatase synthesis response regulator PhoP
MAVLIVDDDPDVLAATREILERLGAWVWTAENGEAGLRVALIHRLHLILIDLDMPLMDGFELARRLRRDTQLGRCRLVALTSTPTRRLAMGGWSLTFDAHLAKPLTGEALTALARYVPGGAASKHY